MGVRPEIAAYDLARAGRIPEALIEATRAVASARMLIPVHGLHVTLLRQLGRQEEAGDALVRAMRLPPDPGDAADAFDALAFAALSTGDFVRANELYRKATQHREGDPTLWYNLASSERGLGRLEAAEQACDRAISVDPQHYQSLLLRSELRVQTAANNHVAELQALYKATNLSERGAMFVGYSLGKELDDLGQYQEAFHCFERASRVRRGLLQYDVATDVQKIDRIIRLYSAEAVSHAGPAADSSRYLFIVGLPRSGTTLLERMMTNLPGVTSNGETDNFAQALFGAAPEGADPFDRAIRADPVRVAEGYRRLSSPKAGARVIEKLPLNYLYIGAIHLALPEARILWVRRSATDSCFAMWRTLFGSGYPFSYDFRDLAAYYAAVERLHRHWHEILPARIHDVWYEDIVADPGAVGAQVARICDLPWADSAVDLTQNQTASMTASAAQIRRPIYQSSVGRWRRYGSNLNPLVNALSQAGVAVTDRGAPT